MKKGIVSLSPFGKKLLTTAVFSIVVISLIVAGHPIKTYETMGKVKADGGHWIASNTEKTIDGLPAIVWKKNN